MVESHTLIRSERLELPLLTLEQLDALAAGDGTGLARAVDAQISDEWVADVRWLAGRRARQVREVPSDAPWLLRAIIHTEAGAPRQAIGHLNFHAGPDRGGRVEIGYSLLPAFRGHGFAIEAVRAAFGWATAVHGIHRFRASVAPDNERSHNLIAKLGFVRSGEQWDAEDGLEYVYELET